MLTVLTMDSSGSAEHRVERNESCTVVNAVSESKFSCRDVMKRVQVLQSPDCAAAEATIKARPKKPRIIKCVISTLVQFHIFAITIILQNTLK